MGVRDSLVDEDVVQTMCGWLLWGDGSTPCDSCRFVPAPTFVSSIRAVLSVSSRGMRLGFRGFQIHGSQVCISPCLWVASAASGSSLFLRTSSAAVVAPHVAHDSVDQCVHCVFRPSGHLMRSVS